MSQMGKEIVLRVCVGTFLCDRLGRSVIQRKKNLGHFCLAEEFEHHFSKVGFNENPCTRCGMMGEEFPITAE